MPTARPPLKAALPPLLLFAFMFHSGRAHAAPVSETEALEIARFWHAAEVNHYYEKGWKRDRENKDRLLYDTRLSQVRYLVGRNALVDRVPENRRVLAYVVEFEPRGNVVIAGDDRFTPLLAFDIDSAFSFEETSPEPGHNVMRIFLNRYASAAGSYLWQDRSRLSLDSPHEGWSNLRSLVSNQQNLLPEEKAYVEPADTGPGGDALLREGTPDPSVAAVLFDTAEWRGDGYYADSVSDHIWWAGDGSPPSGWRGNVPVGCPGVALAILLRYHEWPAEGLGSITHNDIGGDVHGGGTVDFGATSYDWSNMPTSNINDPLGPDFGPNADIAELMYHAAIVIHTNWEIGNSGGNWDVNEMHNVLQYKDTENIFAYSAAGAPEANCQHAGSWGYDYFYCPTPRTWTDARNRCQSAGMELLRIDLAVENDFVTFLGPDRTFEIGPSDFTWIGATDSVVEGEWRWIDNNDLFWQGNYGGSGSFYSNWMVSQPADADPSFDYGAYHFTGEWAALSSGTGAGYFCNRPVNSNLILPHVRDSIVGGLLVAAGVGNIGPNGGVGHAVVLDGYRTVDPLGTDRFVHVNAGWANDKNTNFWFSVYTMPWIDNILIHGNFYQTPTNYIYVDGSYVGVENGSLKTPYNTINEGALAIPEDYPTFNPKGGRLWIKAGSYTAPYYNDKTMEVSSYWGDVDIRGRLHLKSSGSLRFAPNAGALSIP